NVVWTNAPRTAVGTYTVTATIDDPNYAGSVSNSFVIGKATASVTLSSLAQTYDGSAKQPSATTNPAGLAIVWTDTPQTNAGSYSVTATINDSNYAGSATGTLVIDKATATLNLDAATLSQTYNGSARTVSATTSPAGLTSVSITYDGSAAAKT